MQASVRVTPVILALKGLRQDDYRELKVNLGYKRMAITYLQIRPRGVTQHCDMAYCTPWLKRHQGKTSELIFGL